MLFYFLYTAQILYLCSLEVFKQGLTLPQVANNININRKTFITRALAHIVTVINWTRATAGANNVHFDCDQW